MTKNPMFENQKIQNYLEEYLKDRAIRFGFCIGDQKRFYVYDRKRKGTKGVPFHNLSKEEFRQTYERIQYYSNRYGEGLPVGVYATLSRFKKFPEIKYSLKEELGRWTLSRDLAYDLDWNIPSIKNLESIREESYQILEPLWKELKKHKIDPILKSSGKGFHLTAPIEMGFGDTSKEVQKLARYLFEKSTPLELKFENNAYEINFPGRKARLEIHPDLTRVFSIPFSPYPKETLNGKPIVCMPLKSPEQILDYHPVTMDFLEILSDSEIPNYPEPAEVPLKLLEEAEDYFRQPTGSPETPTVSIDNLPPRYRHLKNGVRKGSRDNSATQLIGVLKTCGLSKREALRELLKFNIQQQVFTAFTRVRYKRKGQQALPQMKLKQQKQEDLALKSVPWLRLIAIAYLRYGESKYAKERIRRSIDL